MRQLFKPLTRLVTRLWPMAAIILLLPCIVLAGGKATMITTNQPIQLGGQTVGGGGDMATTTLTWHDSNTMRMDFGDKNAGSLIVRDGKTYSVSHRDGRIQVMDMSVMMKMMQAVGGQSLSSKNLFGSINSVKATGATETVAGIEGRVYHLTWTDPDGSHQSGDAVLTDNPLVEEMTRVYLGAMTGMVGADTTRAFQNALPGKDRGLLRMSDQVRVESISRADLPTSTFDLPAKPMDLQGLIRGLGQ